MIDYFQNNRDEAAEKCHSPVCISPPSKLNEAVESASQKKIECRIFQCVLRCLIFGEISPSVFHIITIFIMGKKMR